MSNATQDNSSGFQWKYITWPFAIIGMLGMAILLYIAVSLFSIDRGSREPVVAVQDDGQAIAFQLGAIRALPGTGFWAVEVVEDANSTGSYSKGYDHRVRNVLLLEEATGKAVRLLPSHDQRIETVAYWSSKGPISVDDIGPADNINSAVAEAAEPAASNRETPIFYIMLIESQTGAQPTQSLLVGKLATQEHKIILDGLSQVDEYWSLGPNKMAVLARKGGALYYHIIDLVSGKVVLTQKVAI